MVDSLRAERERLGLSQADVARALDMTQSEISKMETYERRIDLWEFKLLVGLYRVSDNQHLQTIVEKFLGMPNK
jgi:transcriptional regulator with XRE-family HTH domain